MLSIKEKLAFLDKFGRSQESSRVVNPQHQGAANEYPIIENKSSTFISEDGAKIGLQKLETEWGEVLLREKRIYFDRYQAFDLAAFQQFTADDFVRLGKNQQFSLWQPGNLLFIDTETTGLAGGTGTYIFLVGLARFHSDHLQVKQYYLQHQSMEYPFWHAVLSQWEDIDGIISFNGKSYDIPLIKTRLVLNRIKYPYENLPHLDLLHTARRLWKSLQNYSLSALEEYVLKIRRNEDIAGFMIPSLYFQAILTGDLSPIKAVLKHNVLDIISMAGVALAAARLFNQKSEKQAGSIIGVMQTLTDLQRLQELANISIPSENAAFSPKERALLLLYKARCLKKLGKMDQAVQIWQHYITTGLPFDYEPYRELAKYYEHYCRNPRQAMFFLEKAEARMEIFAELHNYEMLQRGYLQDFAKRKTRLIRKIAKP